MILESGIHESSDRWTLTDTKPPVLASPSVFAGAARYTHVCMYNRPGTIRYTNPPALTTRSTPTRIPLVAQHGGRSARAAEARWRPALARGGRRRGSCVDRTPIPREARTGRITSGTGATTRAVFDTDAIRLQCTRQTAAPPLDRQPRARQPTRLLARPRAGVRQAPRPTRAEASGAARFCSATGEDQGGHAVPSTSRFTNFRQSHKVSRAGSVHRQQRAARPMPLLYSTLRGSAVGAGRRPRQVPRSLSSP